MSKLPDDLKEQAQKVGELLGAMYNVQDYGKEMSEVAFEAFLKEIGKTEEELNNDLSGKK